MIVALWMVFALLLLSWSGLAWAVHALLHLPAGWTGQAPDWLDRLPLAEWMERWWPGWREAALALMDIAQHLLQALAALTPWLTPLLWVLWALGAVLLLLVFGVMHAVVRAASGPRRPPIIPA